MEHVLEFAREIVIGTFSGPWEALQRGEIENSITISLFKKPGPKEEV